MVDTFGTGAAVAADTVIGAGGVTMAVCVTGGTSACVSGGDGAVAATVSRLAGERVDAGAGATTVAAAA
ncbi:MAG TPA: hypothetical protein VFR91_05665, partial [Dyella sp.]|nr:hypothetical protein [Dyella sp.]